MYLVFRMLNVDSSSGRRIRVRPVTPAQAARRAAENYEEEVRASELEELENLRGRLHFDFFGRPTGSRTPATPAPLLGEGGRGIRREAGTQAQMPERVLAPPANLPSKMPEVERRPGAERLHPTSLRAKEGGLSFSMRDIKDLISRDADVGIEPSENPFVMSLWTHVSKENDKHNCANCSVLGNLAPRRSLARKIKYMSLNPSIYGNKYDVLGSS